MIKLFACLFFIFIKAQFGFSQNQDLLISRIEEVSHQDTILIKENLMNIKFFNEDSILVYSQCFESDILLNTTYFFWDASFVYEAIGIDYYQSGFIRSLSINTKDYVSYVEYYESGIIKIISSEVFISNDSYLTLYSPNGVASLYYQLTDEIQNYHEKWGNGNLKVKGKWNPITLIYYGKYREFSPKGDILVKGNYSNTVDSNSLESIKINIWKYYVDGKLVKKEKYNKTGTLLKSIAK